MRLPLARIGEFIAATRQNLLRRMLPIVLIPTGTLLYTLYCWHITGNPLAFISVQSHWGRHTTWPWYGTEPTVAGPLPSTLLSGGYPTASSRANAGDSRRT